VITAFGLKGVGVIRVPLNTLMKRSTFCKIDYTSSTMIINLFILLADFLDSYQITSTNDKCYGLSQKLHTKHI